ncbi:hypothetical protein [Streptomyces avermitilis]|uniref:hypothetical protein n=1 Tax=Streptomyces avermitilis TaxID=33903 RepID=UPI0033A33261
MAAISPASRMVAAAARDRLRPLGLRQRGRSRVWIDDHGWWLGVVEFPSPQWSAGSGLTVGAMWLWQDLDHVAFDAVDRVRGTEEFRNETQFASVASELVCAAEERVRGLRARFADLGAVASFLMDRPPRPGYLWESFNAGVAAGLIGDAAAARERFAAVLSEDPCAHWIRDMQKTAQLLHDVADEESAVRNWARNAVTSCRTKLVLGPPSEASEHVVIP